MQNLSGRSRLGPTKWQTPGAKLTDCRPGRPAAKSRSQWTPSAWLAWRAAATLPAAQVSSGPMGANRGMVWPGGSPGVG
eukprot:28224-Chlamydomonas_euryale.AAC.9